MKLQKKVVLITGSATGIGAATAKLFAEDGASVVLNSNTSIAEGKALEKELQEKGFQATYIQADLTKEEDIEKLFAITIQTYGQIDILINNAGKIDPKGFLETTKEHWISQFDVNFFSAVLCSQKAAVIMQKQGYGKIINTTSVRGIDYGGRGGLIAYSAAKAALINFTKTLAKDLAPTIQVNAIAPGFVYTKNYDAMTEEAKQSLLDTTYLKKWIMPDEIAEGFLFLATSDVVTGHILTIDAGFTLK